MLFAPSQNLAVAAAAAILFLAASVSASSEQQQQREQQRPTFHDVVVRITRGSANVSPVTSTVETEHALTDLGLHVGSTDKLFVDVKVRDEEGKESLTVTQLFLSLRNQNRDETSFLCENTGVGRYLCDNI
ncbi:hypothetical protein HKX48_008213, partial [Thoreauomyces humboldtii]